MLAASLTGAHGLVADSMRRGSSIAKTRLGVESGCSTRLDAYLQQHPTRALHVALGRRHRADPDPEHVADSEPGHRDLRHHPRRVGLPPLLRRTHRRLDSADPAEGGPEVEGGGVDEQEGLAVQ